MPRSTPKKLTDRLRALGAVLVQLLPALVLYALAAAITHPAVLLVLLIADALTMAAICHALGFALEANFAHTVLRRGAAYFVLLAAYAGAAMLLLGWPVLWLLRDGSLAATLMLSTCAVLVLLLLWRHWAAFGLTFVWDDAYPEQAENSWILTALRRCLAFSRHLTGEHELYFSHGLPVGVALLVLVGGALALAGFGTLPSEFRIVFLVAYGAIASPVCHLVIANRTLRALLTARRARRAEHAVVATPEGDADVARADALPGGLDVAELDAALLRAARSGQVELALAALERGASANATPPSGDRDQRPALVIATTLPEVRLLRALIAKGADVNRSHAGLTALLAATRDSLQGRPDAVLTLLANGADPTLADAHGNTPLHHAALAAEPIVAAMLLDASAPLAAINRDGLTPLGVACAAANWPLARFLLERGARSEVEHAQPALLAAAGIAEDDGVGVKLLLKHKSRVDAQGPLGRTALMAAALAGHHLIARHLVEAGANVDIADTHGTTALLEAARAGAVEVIHALATRSKLDVNHCDSLGRNALVLACQSRQAKADSVRALLALGVDRHRTTPDGKRAIDIALTAGRWDLVALIDPDYPLPSYVADVTTSGPMVGADSPAHLLDALRFGHWNVADGFARRLREWPEREIAELALQLAEHADPAPRQWLLTHGLRADASLGASTLFDTLLARLPATLDAAEELLAAGASAAGAGRVRRVLEIARTLDARSVERSRVIALAARLFDRGADPFARNANGETALHLAAQLGAVGIADALLARGADPNARDLHGRTPLHCALGAPSATVVTLVRGLIRYGADPEIAAANGETVLGLALGRADADLTRWLHWPGWSPPRRAFVASDLPAAAVAGDLDAVDKLLLLGLPVESVDAQGASALLRACGQGHLPIVERLLDAGADAEHVAHAGASCLTAAVSAHRDAVVVRLLRHGVAVDRRLPGGGTALMIACALGYPEIAARLLDAGAQPDLADEKGATALHAAAQFAFGHASGGAARALLETLLHRHSAAPNPRNAKGQTPLLLLLGARAEPGTACDPTQLAALLPMLLDHGAELDAKDERGVSALHACAIHGLLGCARQLLARGADRNARDCLGRQPGDLAELLGYREIAAELGSAAAMPSLAQMLRRQARQPD